MILLLLPIHDKICFYKMKTFFIGETEIHTTY